MPFRYELFLEEMLSLVESAEIPISRIDDAVERILRVKFVAGLFEFPLTDRSLLDVVGCKVLHFFFQRLSYRSNLISQNIYCIFSDFWIKYYALK